ncbi:DUF1631 family protein [Ideonella oryzae]|uniref:DUF1631 domain-containing protein n=1 Tax=Ideonella oryzae TaxID=2937441 RepID=A0ABT1BM10_9BURK|nr:DUF1631 family protein [Ideonella oryzae]MCO5977158.1 DUF1631 domain-containing protein [Ideonella oryzae]
MPAAAAGLPTLDEARRHYVDLVLKDLQPLLDAAVRLAQKLNEELAERAIAQQRADMLQSLVRHGRQWLPEVAKQVREQLAAPGTGHALTTLSAGLSTGGGLSLVDDETVTRNILVSRLTLALLDKTTWEFADLRARLGQLSGQPDLEDDDLFRPQIIARCMVRAWLNAGMDLESWRALEPALHKAGAELLEGVFHETNAWLVEQGVLPQVDLRPFIRRTEGTTTSSVPLDGAENHRAGVSTASPAGQWAASAPSSSAGGGHGAMPAPLGANIARVMPESLRGHGAAGAGQVPARGRGPGLTLRPGVDFRTDAPAGDAGATAGGPVAGHAPGGGTGGVAPAYDAGRGAPPATGTGGPVTAQGADTGVSGRGNLGEETRLMTRQSDGALPRADVVLQRFGDILDQHVPGFRQQGGARVPSQQLSQAMGQVQQRVAAEVAAQAAGTEEVVSPARLIAELRERQQTLKQAAATPEERATVELVALLFQAILTDERVPAALRVYFARLQMPVLRVALAEPDFFSGADHPARRLIDRMGACVMGFEGNADLIGTPLEAEIRRVVQVVEAFPDTGRRVFQAVLNEFEKFLEKYFREHNEATKAGVSLAQQIEQRETLAIQYTIELRKMLADVPVQEGVRDFLFHIWADVLATTAVRHGAKSGEVKAVREAATDLMWMATAKTTREERADVIRKLPRLLGVVRQGMGAAGLDAKRQEDAIKALNAALTAAFSARSISMSNEQLEQLKQRLATIEEMMPDDDFELDDSWVLDEANHQHEGLEIVAEGGSMPGPSMLAAAMELQVGSAFTLDFRGRHETVRLAWQGMHKQLSLFVNPQGRCVLFQKARLAAFLQAGLLVSVEDEPLTMAATRDALRKISADPGRLVH